MSILISPMPQAMTASKQNTANNLSTPIKQNFQNPFKANNTDTVTFTSKKDDKKQKSNLSKHLLTGGALGAASGFAGTMKYALYARDGYEKIYREGGSLNQARKTIDFIEEKIPQKLANAMLDLAASDMKKDKNKFRETVKTSKNVAENFILYSAELIDKYKYTMAAVGAMAAGVIGLGAGAVIHKIKTTKEN